MSHPNWLEWAKALQAISQSGLHYKPNQFDKERYEEVGQIAAQIIAEHTNLSEDEFIELNKAELGHATPKVDVRGVVFRHDKLLMIREVLDNGRWTIPGGWADVNETPSQAVEREVLEETGFKTKAIQLLAVFDRVQQGHLPPLPYHVYKLFFRCEIISGKPIVNNEASEIQFFGYDEIPEDLSESRVKLDQINLFFRYRFIEGQPAEFD